MGKDGFAPTSPLPGETRALIFYCVMRALHLVDLPPEAFLTVENNLQGAVGRGFLTVDGNDPTPPGGVQNSGAEGGR